MRLFIAIQFTEEVKTALKNAIGQLKKQSASGNFTKWENLHLTLVFLGDCDNIPLIRKCIEESVSGPFSLTIGGAGRFGDLWWIGVEKNQALEILARRLRNKFRENGFFIETKKFRPHITIARQISSKQEIQLDVPPVNMPVDRISLMKSERIGNQLLYTQIYTKEL